MLFGRIDDFAIEILIDWPLCQLPDPGRHVAGRVRVWLGGEPVGNLDDWGCWLQVPVSDIEERSRTRSPLWTPELEGLTHEQQFDELHRYFFGGRKGELYEDTPEARRLEEEYERRRSRLDPEFRPSFLMHTCEAFDGWSAFTLRRPGQGGTLFLWCKSGGEVRSHETPTERFAEVSRAAKAWLDEQEAEWLRPPSQG